MDESSTAQPTPTGSAGSSKRSETTSTKTTSGDRGIVASAFDNQAAVGLLRVGLAAVVAIKVSATGVELDDLTDTSQALEGRTTVLEEQVTALKKALAELTEPPGPNREP